MSEKQPTIMVIDDCPENLDVLRDMLRSEGYRVQAFAQSGMALSAASRKAPDMILLDIKMPEMDGFEVCARLKSDESLKEIPVIFISALSDTTDKVRAFRAGGVDYVTKPFQFEEVHARVRAHLDLRRQQRDLQESYEKLKEMESLRDSLVHMVVHDMRSPLMALDGFLKMAQMTALPAQAQTYIEASRSSSDVLMDMVNCLLDVRKMESGAMNPDVRDVNAEAVAREVLEMVESLRGGRSLSVVSPAGPVVVRADENMLRRVLQNLVSNSLRFTDEEAGVVSVAFENNGGATARVLVCDNGAGIPAEYHDKLFDKFFQVSQSREQETYSTGLGLTYCKLAVETLGGTIGVDSAVGTGSTFWFELPTS